MCVCVCVCVLEYQSNSGQKGDILEVHWVVQLIEFLIGITISAPNDHKNRFIKKNDYFADYVLQVNSHIVSCVLLVLVFAILGKQS